MGNLGLLLFVLVAAGTVGFLAGRSSAPTVEPSTEGAPTGGPPAPARPMEPLPADAPPLARAIEAIEISRVEPGDGVVTGTVLTNTGVPVEGVRIIGYARRREHVAPPPGEPPTEPTLEEAVRDLVLDRHYRTETRVEARSGADGTFRLTGMVDANYSVQAYRIGYRIWTRNWKVRPGTKLEFMAQAVAVLSLTILDPDGNEVEKAMISAQRAPGDGRNGSAWTPTRRTMELNHGSYAVSATAMGGALKAPPVDVKLLAGAPTEAITLRLAPVPGVRGNIVFPPGEPSRYLSVYAMRWGDEELPAIDALWQSGKRAEPWQGGNQYVFPDLAPGNWIIVLVEGRRIVASARVTIADEMLERDLTIPAPDPADYVVVNVTGPGGTPIENASISVGLRHDNGSSSRGTQPVRLGAGLYRVRHHESDDGEDRRNPIYYLQVSAPEYGQQEIVYDPKATREVTVVFDEPATLTVTVPSAPEGWLGSRLHVGVARKQEGRSISHLQARILDPTTAECGPMTPGEYDVVLRMQAGRHDTISLVTARVTVRAGKNTHSLILPTLYPATILLPEGGTQVRIRPVGEARYRWSFSATAKEGRAVLPGLPAGTYQARVSGGRTRGVMEFTLPGPAEITFEATERNAARIRIHDPDGLLRKTGFRNGDVIVGADGKLFTSEMQVTAALTSGAAMTASTLVVMRDGRRIELTVNLKKLFESRDHQEWGGSFDMTGRPK